MCLFPSGYCLDFLFTSVFSALNIMFLGVCLYLSSLRSPSFLDLYDDVFCLIWEIWALLSSQGFSTPLSLFYFWTLITDILQFDITLWDTKTLFIFSSTFSPLFFNLDHC